MAFIERRLVLGGSRRSARSAARRAGARWLERAAEEPEPAPAPASGGGGVLVLGATIALGVVSQDLAAQAAVEPVQLDAVALHADA